jgi:hypothetical protein
MYDLPRAGSPTKITTKPSSFSISDMTARVDRVTSRGCHCQVAVLVSTQIEIGVQFASSESPRNFRGRPNLVSFASMLQAHLVSKAKVRVLSIFLRVYMLNPMSFVSFFTQIPFHFLLFVAQLTFSLSDRPLFAPSPL